MPERDDKTPFDAIWSEALRGLADIRSKLLAGWFGRDPDTPRMGGLGWTLDEDVSPAQGRGESVMDQLYPTAPEQFVSRQERDPSSLSFAEGWGLPEPPSNERDGPGLDR